MKSLLLLGAFAVAASSFADSTITILHTNDLHARVEGSKVGAGTYGGYARHASLIRKFMASDPNPLLVNAGDTFQGTIFFNVYEGLADLTYLNSMHYRAAAVGNHEFDRGPGVLSNFVGNAQFPILACNLDVSTEAALNGLIKPWTIVQVGKERVGLIGAVTEDLPHISAIGPNVKMLPIEDALNKAVADLTAQKVDKIILLSHCGYTAEQKYAHDIEGLDVIVGGHSHTLLGSFDNKDFPKPEGPYPTVVQNSDGNKTLIVTSWELGKVFGRIKVTFDGKGHVKSWKDAMPIVVDTTVPEDPEMRATIAAIQKPIADFRGRVVGNVAVALDGSREVVRKSESTMANVLADCMWEAGKHEGAQLGLISGGSVRAGIDAGPVTYEEALTVQPFGNSLTVLELTGAEIMKALEHGVGKWAEHDGRFLQVSANVRYAFDPTKPVGSRLTYATIDGVQVDLTKHYMVAMNNFMAGGGDDFTVFRDAPGKRINEPMFDIDMFIQYLKAHPDLNAALEGRITIQGQ